MVEYEARYTYAIECPSPKCPAPHKVKRDGLRGGKQHYECNTCGKKFMAEGQALGRQFTVQQIADAVDSYYSGMSYKQVAEGLEDTYDVPEPSKHSVHDWVKGYTRLALRYMECEVGPDGTPDTATGKRVKANTGDHWVADEIFLRVGGDQLYCWNVMDKDSRYVLAAHLSRHRGTNDAIKVFEKALANSTHPPKKVTTDGLGSYVDAMRAVFPKGTGHEVAEGIYELTNNNLSERLQGSFRQRTKTQRGLQTLRTGQDYLDGWVLDYNFFKKHHALKGRTPAEVAGTAGQVPWGDSWEGITRMGGEVAEPEIKNTVITPLKPGPKPKPGSVNEAVVAYLEAKKAKEAKAKRKGVKSPAVASYPAKPKAASKDGRGKKGMKYA